MKKALELALYVLCLLVTLFYFYVGVCTLHK